VGRLGAALEQTPDKSLECIDIPDHARISLHIQMQLRNRNRQRSMRTRHREARNSLRAITWKVSLIERELVSGGNYRAKLCHSIEIADRLLSLMLHISPHSIIFHTRERSKQNTKQNHENNSRASFLRLSVQFGAINPVMDAPPLLLLNHLQPPRPRRWFSRARKHAPAVRTFASNL
jgi:hypothetical protein